MDKPLLVYERKYILFYKFFSRPLYYPDSYLRYFRLKKNLNFVFEDRILLLFADLLRQKRFLSDQKVVKLFQLMDELLEENKLEKYLENGLTETDQRITKNNLFQRIFPENEIITGFSKEKYNVFINEFKFYFPSIFERLPDE